MGAAGNADFGELTKVQHLVDLGRREHVLTLDQITNQHVLFDRLLGELRGTGVADLWRQSSGQRGRALDPIGALVGVGLDASDATFSEHGHRIAEDFALEKDVERDHGHHHVELELTVLGRG